MLQDIILPYLPIIHCLYLGKRLIMLKGIFWYIRKFLNLCFISLQLFFYGLIHPQKTLYGLLVPIIQAINEFHQLTHARLLDFATTTAFREISQETIFSMTNVFNMDFNVTRPIETQVLSALVRHFQPKTIFEIGTYYGFTTLHMAYNSPQDCKIYTLDLPVGYDQQQKEKIAKYSYSDQLVVKLSMESSDKRIFRKTEVEHKIQELYGNSKEFDFSPYYGKMDLILIDGNHTYDFVKSDTAVAMKMLSPRGIILWHDFDFLYHRGIFRFLNELAAAHKIYSIPKTRFAIYGKELR